LGDADHHTMELQRRSFHNLSMNEFNWYGARNEVLLWCTINYLLSENIIVTFNTHAPNPGDDSLRW
jgi:hypothetical protein